jgi:hypothetical protein
VGDFFDEDLLETQYFKILKEAYEDPKNALFLRPHRSHQVLLDDLSSIYQYKQEHARYYAKRIKTQQRQFRDCEAVFTETIVYAYYLRLVHEGILRSLDRKENDYDLRIDMHDSTSHFLEIFSIMPDIKVWTKEEIEKGEMKACEIKTHLQDAFASIRQKLLRKIDRQGQMSKPRKNFAVIELNNPIIADDFAILSSLSNGYKITIDTKNMKVIGEGYDWSESVFDEPSLHNLAGIIYFGLGDYSRRKFIFNPNFRLIDPTTIR